jgi:hypothetical protein
VQQETQQQQDWQHLCLYPAQLRAGDQQATLAALRHEVAWLVLLLGVWLAGQQQQCLWLCRSRLRCCHRGVCLLLENRSSSS